MYMSRERRTDLNVRDCMLHRT